MRKRIMASICLLLMAAGFFISAQLRKGRSSWNCKSDGGGRRSAGEQCNEQKESVSDF